MEAAACHFVKMIRKYLSDGMTLESLMQRQQGEREEAGACSRRGGPWVTQVL